MDQDAVFKALADPSRRKLLDVLHQQDGQTLNALSSHLEMTRFGCMKHLQVLEDAGLVVARKVGREKLHYLNTIPIQLVYDRWVSKYAQRWSTALTSLKFALEDETMAAYPSHVFEVYIRTTPERLWQALTDGSITQQYYYGTAVQSTWQPGARMTYEYPDNGGTMIDGEVLEADPPRKLVTTFIPLFEPEGSRPTSKVTWEILPMGATCKLTLIHESMGAPAVTAGLISGWSQILSGLKTLLETGEVLVLEVAQTA
jgi:uncharacterized protein YndB with AHSA1/START domain/DNA-binding transcriptional ArsR family regulator